MSRSRGRYNCGSLCKPHKHGFADPDRPKDMAKRLAAEEEMKNPDVHFLHPAEVELYACTEHEDCR